MRMERCAPEAGLRALGALSRRYRLSRSQGEIPANTSAQKDRAYVFTYSCSFFSCMGLILMVASECSLLAHNLRHGNGVLRFAPKPIGRDTSDKGSEPGPEPGLTMGCAVINRWRWRF